MADRILAARSALSRFVRSADQPGHSGGFGVTLGERHPLGIVSVIARNGMAAAVSAAAQAEFGIVLPLQPRRAAAGSIAFVWQGPDRWLAVDERQSSEALLARLAGVFGDKAALAEQGDGRAVIRIAGPSARDVLARLVAIDLHPRAFRTGDTAVTGAAHIDVQLWQLDDAPSYELVVPRGFAGSFWHRLTQASAEYGYRIAAG